MRGKKLKSEEPTPISISDWLGDVQQLSTEYSFSITDSTVAIPFKIIKDMFENEKQIKQTFYEVF